MPFKKLDKNKYVSPSGRKWTAKQVRMYYATNGTMRKNAKRKERKTTKKR
jgi:hypothetical protein